jgi:hypothetical protein
MLIAINKKIQSGYLCSALYFLALLLLILGVGVDLFHNHEPDLIHHDDCSVCLIIIMLSGIYISIIVIAFVALPNNPVAFNSVSVFSVLLNRACDSRAPPFKF